MQGRVYPSWRYHKSEAPKVIHSEAEHEELGKDWAMSPAHFEKNVEEGQGEEVLGEMPEQKPARKPGRNK